jgi:uncharacterized protein (TIGR03437 family)
MRASHLGLAIFFSLGATIAAYAQSGTYSTGITLSDFTGSGSGNNHKGVSLSGNGSILPFGAASVSIGGQEGAITFTFTLSDGTFSGLANSGIEGGLASVNGGTGIFAGVTGSFTFVIGCTIKDCTVKNVSFTMTGGGTLVLQSSAVSGPSVVCDGGPGVQVGIPSASGAPEVTIQVCQGDAPPGAGNPLGFPAAGDIGVPLTFTGSGSPLLVANSSSSTTTVYLGQPPILSTTTTYVAITTCGNTPPTTLATNTCWIVINNANATTVEANTGAVLPAVVNPQSLVGGYYNATVSITPTATNGAAPQSDYKTSREKATGGSTNADTVNIPISLLVTSGEPMLMLSPTGLHFQAVSGVGGTATQSVSIANTSGGSLSFSATASTLTGGNWLSVSQTSSQIQVQANPANLAAGTYFGRVDVAAQGAANSPQSVEVALTVLASTASTGPLVGPSGLVFVAEAGANPAPQNIQVSNPSNQTLNISTQAVSGGLAWLSVTSSGSALASGQSLAEAAAVNASGLAAGVYRGTLNINAAETNSTYPVAIVLVVTPATGTCTPTQLLPVFTNLANNFQTEGGLPVALQAQVVDDCGAPLTSGAVVAYFPQGDPSVSLASLGNGLWSGTWLPHKIAGGTATAGMIASSSTSGLYGTTAITGAVSANANAAVVNAGGVVDDASFAGNAPLAPGSYIAIFGSNLAAGSNAAGKLPLPTMLGGTQVLLGTKPLPLEFAGNGQINAVIPYDVPVNATQQLIVTQNDTYSLPETVVLVPAQPAVFTQNQSGSGAGAITVVKTDGTQFLNTPSTPASAGDALTIYCAGLGAVIPAVSAGSAAPSSPLSNTVNAVTVTIGGQSLKPSFAGLAPGYAGLYQVNVLLPSGVATGSSVPLIVSAAGASSLAVTVAIQ